jgi:hypothetical protein
MNESKFKKKLPRLSQWHTKLKKIKVPCQDRQELETLLF